MRKVILAFALLLFHTVDSSAQKTLADSLQQKLPFTKDTARVTLLNKISTLIASSDSKKSLALSQEALKLAQDLNSKNGIAQSHRALGIAWLYNNDHQQATENLQLSGDMALANKQWELAIQNYLNLGGMYCSIFGNYVKGMEFYTKALGVCESENIAYKIYDAYSGIAYVYQHQHENKKALDYYMKALGYLEKTNDHNSLGILYQNIGEHYQEAQQLNEAVSYLAKSLEAFKRGGSKGGTISTLTLLSDVCRQQGFIDKALAGDMEALAISKTITYERAKYYVYNSLGKTYYAMKEYAKSKGSLEEAIAIAEKVKMNEEMRDTYLSLARVSDKLSNHIEAYRYQQLHTAYADSVRSKERTSQLTEMEVRFESERKEKENQLLKKDNDLNRLYITVITISFVSVVAIGFLFFNRQRLKMKSTQALMETEKKLIEAEAKNAQLKQTEKLQRQFNQQLADVEMKALKAQMNPHFIFNSLNSINWYIIKSESEKASLYLTKFSKLIRLILDNSNHKIISLDQEMTALKLYLDLEVLRFNEKFTYSIFIQPELNPLSVGVPPMIIQPFVENAIWHGLLHKEEVGKLDIEITRMEGGVKCVITDNGIGRKKAAEMKSKTADKDKSYGMKITGDRLNMLNRESIVSSVEIIDLEDVEGQPLGTQVIVKILSAEIEPEF
ncbi:MAG: tetratricopeptide repeat protein [Cyclobacteriaceae bacterium]|jgi:LytS/YehU family sensor histidine kinase|nr:tetratricopeptide repeat protein [Flammeovirgaceae bacterium]